MDEFLDTYEEHRAKDTESLEEHEQHIVMILEAMSRVCLSTELFGVKYQNSFLAPLTRRSAQRS